MSLKSWVCPICEGRTVVPASMYTYSFMDTRLLTENPEPDSMEEGWVFCRACYVDLEDGTAMGSGYVSSRAEPSKCVVCEGSGSRPLGFYPHDPNSPWCKSCGTRGIHYGPNEF